MSGTENSQNDISELKSITNISLKEESFASVADEVVGLETDRSDCKINTNEEIKPVLAESYGAGAETASECNKELYEVEKNMATPSEGNGSCNAETPLDGEGQHSMNGLKITQLNDTNLQGNNTDAVNLNNEANEKGTMKEDECEETTINESVDERNTATCSIQDANDSEIERPLYVVQDSVEKLASTNDMSKLQDFINQNKNNVQILIAILFKHNLPGIQDEICKHLKRLNITAVIPQIVQILFRTEPMSFAIYNLLLYKAKYSQSFRLTLYYALKTVSSQSEKRATVCFYLCCKIFEFSQICKNKDIKINKFGKARKNHYTRSMACCTKKPAPVFEGLILNFARAAASIISRPMYSVLDRKYNVYLKPKTYSNTTSSPTTNNMFKQTLLFYDNLVGISNRLRKMPQPLRSRALQAELEILSLRYSLKSINFIDPSKIFIKIRVAECETLDSAENVPYMAYIETIDSNARNLRMLEEIRRGEVDERDKLYKLNKTKYLQSHLQSINEIGDVGDINGIRENILNALEKVLFANNKKRRDDKKSCLSVKNYESEYSHLKGWGVTSFIIKSGAILKQEYLAYQILSELKNIFAKENLKLYIRNYKIFILSETTGLVEAVERAFSIHKIKGKYKTIFDFFREKFSGKKEGAVSFEKAKENFLNSLVGYSLASYFLQIKDRHNGNILVDSEGHLVHVDFGFVLGKYPGFYGIENAPFKMATEYLDLIEMEDFKRLFIEGFHAIRKNGAGIKLLIEILEGSGYCDLGTAVAFEGRLRKESNPDEIEEHCKMLIERSVKSMMTGIYDRFQYYSNGYL
ncbi:phosphatidylinositol 4-kinase B [Enteropsectra breve]|nr:phosphatidylinositol 4-kinase B [Enteropsectra breve]